MERPKGFNSMRTSTRWLILAVAVVALLASAGTASADSFTINFSGSGFNGTLDVDATLVSSGVYSIDTISGNVGFTPVTGLVPTTTSTGYSYYSLPDGSSWFYDNLLFASSDPVVDNGGILFTLAGLAQPVNLFSNPQGQFGIYIGGGNYPNDFVINPVQVSVVSTPEPSALVLGLGGLAFLLACLAKRKFAAPILSRQSA
jgi:hypothetical protein